MWHLAFVSGEVEEEPAKLPNILIANLGIVKPPMSEDHDDGSVSLDDVILADVRYQFVGLHSIPETPLIVKLNETKQELGVILDRQLPDFITIRLLVIYQFGRLGIWL